MENLFLVCLIPPVSIVEDVDAIRTDLSERFAVLESLKRPAHITLYNPVKISSSAEELKFFKALEDASFADPFTQVIKNYNSFEPHTVYINVDQNEGIMQLQSQIKKALKPLNLLPQKESFKFTPHLTIAFKDVKPNVYAEIMDELKDKKFKREFLVGSFSVYKHIDKKWRPYKEYLFKKPQMAKSLSLFD
jgi:2'-5' RNA ligase